MNSYLEFSLRPRVMYKPGLIRELANEVGGMGATRAFIVADPGIVRNRLKVAAAIGNARATLAVQAEFSTLDRFLWQFAPPPRPRPASLADVPAATPASDAMSTALRQRGFRFVGSTICYAFMQASGMVDDHTADCFRAARPAAP